MTVVNHLESGLLSVEQVAEFDRAGYLILRDRVPGDLLDRLREAADDWIADGEANHHDDGTGSDFVFAHRPTGRRLYRVNYVHGKGKPASLELLGCPAVLSIAESLAGPNFVPTYESLVFKGEDDGAPIHWHQDAVHPRTHRIFNVDVYLDDSRPGAGSLRVVPGSQRQRPDLCDLDRRHGWDIPGAVQTDLRAGDVLVHDVMLVHGSDAVRGNRLRRTLYYEFRAAEQILAEGPWDASWIERRMRLLPLALREHARRRPDAPQFVWRADDRYRPTPSGDDVAELRVAHTTHSPANFCSAGSVTG